MKIFNILKQLATPKRLHNWFYPIGGFGNRPTSANIPSDNYGGMRKFLATDSMTEGKPPRNGHIINLDWDNASLYSSQIYSANGNGEIWHRALPSSDGWTQWYRCLSTYNTADYIVEQGTSGIWTYRKWNSGVAECWTIYTTTLTSYATAWQGASAFYTSVTFPTGLFIEMPNLTSDFKCDSVLAISCGGLHSITKTGTNLYGISVGASGSQSCTWNVQVVGKWK